MTALALGCVNPNWQQAVEVDPSCLPRSPKPDVFTKKSSILSPDPRKYLAET